jgi:hypothetical protein
MASTIKTNARGWQEVSSTANWTARVLQDTGTALYAVVQDTGATPKVRVMKANSRIAPTTWTEQDSANNKAITNVDYPFSSCLHTNGDLHIIVFTATNTITHYVFDTDTDLWGSGLGIPTGTAENEHSIRVAVRSDGDVLVSYTDNTDDADIWWSRHEGVSWTGVVHGSGTSVSASNMLDACMDSTDRFIVVTYQTATNDYFYRAISADNVLGAAIAIEADAAISDSQVTGSRFNMYDDSGTDKIIVAYIDTGLILEENVLTLETIADAGNVSASAVVESTAANVGARTPTSTAVLNGLPYAAWWDDASSGTLKYSTKSGGTWAAATNFATGITNLIEIVPVGSSGLAIVYQSGTDVVFDWIVTPIEELGASAQSAEGILSVAGRTVQVVRPTSDVLKVGWADQSGATTNLFSVLDELNPDEADYAKQYNPTGANPLVVGAGTLADPNVHTGHIISYRIAGPGVPIDWTVRLLQTTTEIAQWTHTDITTAQTFQQTLTEGQAAAITDYAALRLEFDPSV